MTYPGLDSVNATRDITQLLVYCNTVTDGYFAPFVLYSFFLLVLIGGYIAQVRFSGRARFSVAFVTASFVSAGMAIILTLAPGLLYWYHVLITIALSAAGLMWVYFEEQ